MADMADMADGINWKEREKLMVSGVIKFYQISIFLAF
jgi:hypothetical protein